VPTTLLHYGYIQSFIKKKRKKKKVVYTFWFIDHYLKEKAESDLIASFIKHACTNYFTKKRGKNSIISFQDLRNE